jgi:uncharacterized damage-inducible protein DinB
MGKNYRTGAAGALLDEYERAIADLQHCISNIDHNAFIKMVDHHTADPNCKSIQTILTHVVRAGYTYAIEIKRLKGQQLPSAEKITRDSIAACQADLQAVFLFTVEAFKEITEDELEEHDQAKKMRVSWGQYYDIEQLMEHAIVHILRHRRQIERFKEVLLHQ